jgi:DNA mismatch repair protein MutS
MQADKTTLTDLAIFNAEEEQSVFHYLNFTKTVGGKEWLRYFLSNPYNSLKNIDETQQTIQQIIDVNAQWQNTLVSNGTIMVVETFYETGIEEIPHNPGLISSFYYSVFSAPDFSVIRCGAWSVAITSNLSSNKAFHKASLLCGAFIAGLHFIL